MVLRELFEKEDRFQYQMVEYFHEVGIGVYANEELMKQMNLSNFTLKKYTVMLNRKWQQIFGNQLIIIADHEVTLNEEIDTFEVNHFRDVLIEESLGFKMLADLLCERFELNHFAQANFISKSKVYEIRKRVSIVLQKYNIQIYKDELFGREASIRSFMLDFFLFRDVTDIGLGPDGTERVNRVKRIILMNLTYIPTNTQSQRLDVFLTIIEIRHRNDKWILHQNIDLELDEEAKTLAAYLKRQLILPEDVIDEELHYLLLFLYAYGYIDKVTVTDKLFLLQVSRVEERFTDAVLEPIFRIYPYIELRKELGRELQRIHIRFQLFPISDFTFESKGDSPYLKEIYWYFDQLVSNFLSTGHPAKDLTDTRVDVNLLYNEYMFLLIKFIPLNEVSIPVHICIDFYQSEGYSIYVTKTLKRMVDMNIIIESKVTSQTDILISDSECLTFHGKQVIWRTLPQRREWLDLITTLLRTQREKERPNAS